MASFEETKVRYSSPAVTIAAYTCAYPHITYSSEMAIPVACFALPRSGVCVKKVCNREVFADPNHVLFFNQNEPYRIRHEACNCKDCGTSICIESSALAEIVGAYADATPENPTAMFPHTHGQITPAVVMAHRVLLRMLDDTETTPLEIEETVLGLADAVVATSCANWAAQHQEAQRKSAGAAAAELADAVKMYLAPRFREVLSLDEIADSVCCSRFHLCRAFSRSAQMPLYRYIHRLRLNEAVQRLADGEKDLTRLAMDLGYSSHSHFTNIFRREFGDTPSAVRGQLHSA